MNLKIVDVKLASSDEWDSVWKNCEYATYFHSREWAVIWQKYTNGKMNPEGRLFVFSDGKRALLPISSQKIFKGFLKEYYLSPAGTFGGWLSSDELSVNHGELLYNYILATYKNLTWRINPYDPVINDVKINFSKQDETQTLNLVKGFDEIYKGWTKGHASAARKARKVGVKIREANSVRDWQEYYRIYEDSINRWGETVSFVYTWPLFHYLFDASSPKTKLWLATYQEKIISGSLCFYANNHVVYWHGASLSDYFSLRPVNLLIYEIIKHACDYGYRWFDFNPSGGHEGTKRFKKSFGTIELKSPVIEKISKTTVFANTLRAYYRSRK